MNPDKLLLLQEGLAHLEQAASHLALSHEYAADRLPEIYQSVAVLTPRLLAVVPKVLAYAVQLAQHYAWTTKGK